MARRGMGLSRESVVSTAVALIDEHGLTYLSMRSLGAELGVEAMALYRYVAGREDLLEAVVQRLVAEILTSDDVALHSSTSWQEYLQGLSHAVRRIALDHPSAFPLVATRHPAAPWLRPPLRSLEVVEHFLTTLASHGVGEDDQALVYKSFSSFLLGHLLLEVSIRGAETSPAEEPLDEGDANVPGGDQEDSLDNYPAVRRSKQLLSRDDSDQEFETGLESLLDRLDLHLSQ